MNNDEQFEQRLRRQPLRQVPAEWREEILAAADLNRRSTAAQSVSEDQAALLAGWRLVFGRLPLAWAALAALWVALIGVNLTMPSPIVRVTEPMARLAEMESLVALDSPHAELELPSPRLLPAPEAAPAPETPAVPRRPRSEYRHGMDFGEARPDSLFAIIA